MDVQQLSQIVPKVGLNLKPFRWKGLILSVTICTVTFMKLRTMETGPPNFWYRSWNEILPLKSVLSLRIFMMHYLWSLWIPERIVYFNRNQLSSEEGSMEVKWLNCIYKVQSRERLCNFYPFVLHMTWVFNAFFFKKRRYHLYTEKFTLFNVQF